MIAHRLSTVTGAECIYVIKDGGICEAGRHCELIEQDGLYAHMWKEYNSDAKWKVGVQSEID